MPSQADHALVLKKLLPEGPAWNTSDQTDGTTAFDKPLNALALEPERLDAAAEALIALTIPDTVDCDLDAWERICGLPDECNVGVALTDQERLGAIVAKLRGRGAVSREAIESVFQALRTGVSDVRLLDRATPQFRVGTSAVGEPLRGDQWLATRIAEYMTNAITNPDDFINGWVNLNCNITPAQFGSPVTQDMTASRVDFLAGAASMSHQIPGDDGDVTRASLWVRSVSGDHTVSVGIVDRSGAIVASNYNMTPSWGRIELRRNVGAGANPALLLITGTGPFSVYASWAVAGVASPMFECQARHEPPITTTGEFNVLGENGP